MQGARTQRLAIRLIALHPDTQPRAKLNKLVVAEYAEALEEGARFPPVTVFYDGEVYRLADGYHRVRAHKQLGRKRILAEVRTGTARDATLHPVGANATHGIPRLARDKYRAVEIMLADEEWGKWSDREIARQCSVSHTFVGGVRLSLSPDDSSIRSYITKHGRVAEMDVSRIGRRRTHDERLAKNPAPPFRWRLDEHELAQLWMTLAELVAYTHYRKPTRTWDYDDVRARVDNIVEMVESSYSRTETPYDQHVPAIHDIAKQMAGGLLPRYDVLDLRDLMPSEPGDLPDGPRPDGAAPKGVR